MKALKKIAQEFKAVFEGNRCRFADECELYQVEGATCNNYYKRFLEEGKVYCGRYRSMEDEEKEE